jgi:hypothetical protein
MDLTEFILNWKARHKTKPNQGNSNNKTDCLFYRVPEQSRFIA